MKQQVFYIHGGNAFSEYQDYLAYLQSKDPEPWAEPKQRWSSALAETLGEEYEVFTPAMPNKYNAQYIEWKIWFENHFPLLRDDVILVGWSQGAVFLAKYLAEEALPFSVRAFFLVAPVFGDGSLKNDRGEDGGDFIFDTSRLDAVAAKVGEIHILHSTDDFVVPYEHAERYAAAWPDAILHTFTDKNHFLVPELPELVDLIRKVS